MSDPKTRAAGVEGTEESTPDATQATQPAPPIIDWDKVRYDANGAPYNVDDPKAHFMTDPTDLSLFAIKAHPAVITRIMNERASRQVLIDPFAEWWARFGDVPKDK